MYSSLSHFINLYTNGRIIFFLNTLHYFTGRMSGKMQESNTHSLVSQS